VIHRLAIPTPFRVGRVNCYLIDDDPLTLVDAGPNWGDALVGLADAVRGAGRRLEDLERIVITHQHADHLGLVGLVADRSGAAVCALDAFAPVVEDYASYADRNDELAQAVMRRHGVEDRVVTVLAAVTRAHRAWGGSAPVGERLRDGGELAFAGRRLEIHHRPGHSPSDTVLFDPGSGELIAGDHLIRNISSNPVISAPLDPGGRRGSALLSYMASLRATREMDVRTVLPGHGDPFGDHAALIDDRFAMHERRAAKIHALIAERPRTAHELAHAIWGGVALTQTFLTLSEVLGHIDLLVERGQVAEHEDGGVVRWTKSS
jgi:glyoxylase-like metal-dependent hydrolase (beta-lactamase superfamily II)